ncbi:hypothetical protein BDV29DRAFT_168433 [Aspergillus leporis]|uniref:Uncharacterized protein n=1 Tax=Aspergillus leporis TaxID=41062 RepID=A0A5N5XAZ0_9EURO|nr:hypothetical protein BDV29DRAFT_168433 [Aspergillus leporis]
MLQVIDQWMHLDVHRGIYVALFVFRASTLILTMTSLATINPFWSSLALSQWVYISLGAVHISIWHCPPT